MLNKFKFENPFSTSCWELKSQNFNWILSSRRDKVNPRYSKNQDGDFIDDPF